MHTQVEFLSSLQREVDITIHLVAQLKPEHLAYRFTPGQKSIQELLVYLATQLTGSMSFLTTGNWDGWKGYAQANADVTLASFPVYMARQMAEVRRMVQDISEQEFSQRLVKGPFGDESTLATGAVEITLKFATSYKMQLFLQAKAAGLTSLVSSNLWQGANPCQ